MISTFMRLDRLGAFIPLRGIYVQGPLCYAMPLPLASPNLDTIEIRNERTESELAEIGFASSLQSISQSTILRSLYIDGPFRDITFRILPDFSSLHRLTMSLKNFDIPAHFLKRFSSSMPSLQYLQIYINDCRSEPPNDGTQRLGQAHSIVRSSFPSLQTLEVGCDSTHLGNLLGVLDTPLLESFSLTSVESTPIAHFHYFVVSNREMLKDMVHKLNFRTVGTSLALVRFFEKLEHLTFSSWHRAVSLSDIKATFTPEGLWSRSLVYLHLKQGVPNHPFGCLPLSALLYIADACPELKSLEISICRPDRPKKQLNNQSRTHHHLKNLVFINLPNLWPWDESMPLAIDLASYLDLIFPVMEVPRYTGAGIDKPGALTQRYGWWNGVQEMWRTFQTIKDRQCVNQPPSA